MKTNAIVRIVIWSIVLLLLVSILGTGLLFDRYSFTQGDATWLIPIVVDRSGDSMQYDYAVPENTGFSQIEIEWAAGTITIQPGDTDRILFSESGVMDEDERLVYSQKGNKLSIQYQKQEVYIGIHSTAAKDLIITVPQDWTGDSIEIDAASARLEIRDINVRELSFDSASGMGIFENCTIEELEIETASGDMEFYGALDKLSFEAMSAKLTAVLSNHPRSLELDSMSGDLDITLPDSCGFTVSIDAMSSDFTTDFETSTQKGSQVHGDGSCRIKISAMSGDIRIRKGK